jgi:hypothetical protein
LADAGGTDLKKNRYFCKRTFSSVVEEDSETFSFRKLADSRAENFPGLSGKELAGGGGIFVGFEGFFEGYEGHGCQVVKELPVIFHVQAHFSGDLLMVGVENAEILKACVGLLELQRKFSTAAGGGICGAESI